jgi:hypothetical protein
MTNSYSIIRRFTPPTCTLEIWGKNSPLSRWTNKIIVKDVRFKLSFDDPRILEIKPITLSGNSYELERLYDLVLSYTESFLEQSFTNRLSTLTSIARNNNQSYLKFQELVNHQINLGDLTLTSEENLTLISLSATQLFDLVAALEEYKTEINVLAQLEAKQKQETFPWLPIGMSVAGILLAVGLTTVGIQVANQSQKENPVASTPESQSQTNINTSVEDVIPPEIPKTDAKAASKTPKNDPLSSTIKLPPPPAVDIPKPPPDIPDPAKYPPSGNLTLPPIASSKPNSTLKTAKSTQKTQSQIDNSQVESTISIPPETAKPIAKPASPEVTSTTRNQNSPAPAVTNTVTKNNDIQALESKKQAEISVNENNEKNTAIFRNNAQLETSEALSQIEIAEEDTVFKDITRDEPKSQIPQVKQIEEITNYFQQKWRSPLDLKQTLEYRLILNQNGSLKRVIPIGKTSEIYLDRTNIPLMGEPFVSALAKNQQNLTIRLLLSPDGEVRTFLE